MKLFTVYTKTGKRAAVVLEDGHVVLVYDSGVKRAVNREYYTIDDYYLILHTFIREGYRIAD